MNYLIKIFVIIKLCLTKTLRKSLINFEIFKIVVYIHFVDDC